MTVLGCSALWREGSKWQELEIHFTNAEFRNSFCGFSNHALPVFSKQQKCFLVSESPVCNPWGWLCITDRKCLTDVGTPLGPQVLLCLQSFSTRTPPPCQGESCEILQTTDFNSLKQKKETGQTHGPWGSGEWWREGCEIIVLHHLWVATLKFSRAVWEGLSEDASSVCLGRCQA